VPSAIRNSAVGAIKSRATGVDSVEKGTEVRLGPSLARSFVTLLLLVFATQMLAPSKATNWGPLPSAKSPSFDPSLASRLVTLALPLFATHMLVPSRSRQRERLPRGIPPSAWRHTSR
jgi:hypothetical protein